MVAVMRRTGLLFSVHLSLSLSNAILVRVAQPASITTTPKSDTEMNLLNMCLTSQLFETQILPHSSRVLGPSWHVFLVFLPIESRVECRCIPQSGVFKLTFTRENGVSNMSDDFQFKNSRIRKWLASALLAALFFVIEFPPAFWLCVVGAMLVAVGSIANSARTDQWMSWQNEGALNWFEGWVIATGAVLIVLPLVAILFRSWFS
jgi:hypothetical protein